MLKQRLQQKLLQKLSPQQIQMIKLLEIPALQLEQRVKKELEENPLLEEGENDDYDKPEPDHTKEEDDQAASEQEEFSFEDYFDEEEYIPSYKLAANNYSADDKQGEMPFTAETSFHDFLENQLGELHLDDRELKLALHILGSIDEDGYLRRDLNSMVDDIAFSQNIETTKHELLQILSQIQEFEPAGVGARDLQECLLLQIESKSSSDKAYKDAKYILKNYFEEFTKKHYDRIAQRLNLNNNDLKAAIDEILRLNPKPGSLFSNHYTAASEHVIPDFLLEIKEGQLYLSLNNSNVPELRISRSYSDLIEGYRQNKAAQSRDQKELVGFVKQKLESAKWFIDAIKQRQSTLLVTMEAILEFQTEYFRDGDEKKLKPMILKDIADLTELDISTISRVANSKYIQTHFGVFPLKYFFSEGIQNDSGEEISTHEVKNILRECIANENKRKPLTDDELTDILKEKGYPIARRTIAKYREQMDLPVARLRKELN